MCLLMMNKLRLRETEIQNDSDVDISVVETVDETLNEIE